MDRTIDRGVSHASGARKAAALLALSAVLTAGVAAAGGGAGCPPAHPPAVGLQVVDPKPDPAPKEHRPVIQLALLLDTSNSMDGLIAQAKTELWSIVNTLAMTKRRGQRADIRVALYEYGNNGLPASEGYVRMVCPLTSDLDRVSEQLFSLRTNGGNEYCGRVIQDATRQLEWSGDDNDLRLIVVAGNEPFTQGETPYREAIREAVARRVVVNTVFCGGREEGARTGWLDGARLGEGTFAVIDPDQTMDYIRCPQDDRIGRLNAELNTTYLAYGASGRIAMENQARQDRNAESALPHAGASVARAVTKASAAYVNSHWDLVDAVRDKVVDIRSLPADELPPEMQRLSVEERAEYVARRAADRARIQREIAELQRERETYLQQQRAAQGNKSQTLGAVLTGALRDQATKLGYEFER